jgi:hypothetical protein
LHTCRKQQQQQQQPEGAPAAKKVKAEQQQQQGAGLAFNKLQLDTGALALLLFVSFVWRG